MTRKPRILILLLLPATMLDAKCTCVHPHPRRPINPISSAVPATPVFSPVATHNTEPIPSPIPAPTPMPITPVTDIQPQPVIPMPIIESLPNLEDFEDEEEAAVPPEKVSKDEVRKVALVLSSIMATAMVVVGALIARIHTNTDLRGQLAGLREQLQHDGEKLQQNTEAIEKMSTQLQEKSAAQTK